MVVSAVRVRAVATREEVEAATVAGATGATDVSSFMCCSTCTSNTSIQVILSEYHYKVMKDEMRAKSQRRKEGG